MLDTSEVLADLKKTFGSKILLSPEDLAPLIATSIAVQANMRSQGRFPLPIRKIGSRIGVSIYHVAEFIAHGEVKVAIAVDLQCENKTATCSTPPKKPVVRRTSRLSLDNAWMRAMTIQLEFQERLQKAVRVEIMNLMLKENFSEKTPRPFKP